MGMGELDNAIELQGSWRQLVLLDVALILNLNCKPWDAMQMWPDIIKKSKEGGLDVIETYVFWNYHEPVKGKVWSSGLSKCNGTIYDVYNG